VNFISDNLDYLENIILMISVSFYFRFLLRIVGQTWIKTVAHTSTLLLLPILTYVITSVISGNIALSLGMVGALSIVRFRNPVRSPLELSVYFGAITIGITTAVSRDWLGLLFIGVTLVCIILYFTNKLTRHFSSKPYFISSFSEGNIVSTLHVVSSDEIRDLQNHRSLSSKTINKDAISYTLADSDFEKLKIIEESLRNNNSVHSLQLSK
jgi:hypothetical protein